MSFKIAKMASADEYCPDEFICPISQEMMEDPYIDTDGNSYEKKYIEEWLAVKGLSPITRNPMHISKLTPNRALKNMIEVFKHNTGYDRFLRCFTIFIAFV